MLKDGRAYFGGIMTCGSVWECPACSLKIKAERARELQSFVEDYGVQRCIMATLTVRHSWGMEPKPLRQGLTKAWQKLVAGAGWKAALARWQIQGFVKAIEVTHGPNGFHPHLHVLFFAQHLSATELTELQAWLSDRWLRIVQPLLGPDSAPDSDHGVRVTQARAGSYLAKMGLEVVGGTAKLSPFGYRTPFELAADGSLRGNKQALRHFVDYCDRKLTRQGYRS